MPIRGIASISVLRFSFYISIFLSEIQRSAIVYSRWFAILSQEHYPFLPKVILNQASFLFIKYIFLSLCLLCAFSVCSSIFSGICLVFGTTYYVLLYSVGFGEHHLHLVWHVLVVFAIYENLHVFKLREFIFIVRFLFVSVFFSAAITKLNRIRFDWFTQNTLMDFLLSQRLYFSGHGFDNTYRDLNYWAVHHIGIVKIFFYLVLPLEFFSPLALLRKGRILVLFLAALQISSTYMLYASFTEWIGIYVFWLVRAESDFGISWKNFRFYFTRRKK